MNAEATTEQKSYIESCIRKNKDGSLYRVYGDLECVKTDVSMVAEVFAQYLALRHIVETSIAKIEALGERRFGKETFEKASTEAWAQLRKNPEIYKALKMIPWAEPDQPTSSDE